MKYTVSPIPSEIAAEVRTTLISPQYESLKADMSLATGYGAVPELLAGLRSGSGSQDILYL